MDFTVTTRAVVSALYVQLPANGSELVLFDLNRAAKLGPLLRTSTETVLTRILPPRRRAGSGPRSSPMPAPTAAKSLRG